MNLVSYFNSKTLERDNSGELGLLTETIADGLKFFPIDSDHIWDGFHGIKSFALHVDNGSCSFSKEFRKSGDRVKPYWYASKRINGKLKRLYFGNEFTKDRLIHIVDKLQNPPDRVENIELPKGIEENSQDCTLAGHGKSENHIQSNLFADNELEIAKNEIASLKSQLADSQKRINLQKDVLIDLDAKLSSRNKLLDKLEADNRELSQIVRELSQIVQSNSKLTNALESRIANLQKTLDERDSELFTTHEKLLERDHTIEMQSSLIKSLRQDIANLEHESSKREDDVAGYAFMYDEHSQRILFLESMIAKYRQMTTGKNKKAHPRYAYLIDFLGEIDNFS